MGLYINSATGSLGLTRSLYQTSVMQSTTMKRLSSGIRINSASDDAAGLSLSEKLKSSINGNTVAKNNAQTGIALLNTADSALSNMTNSLERIRNLAVQAANGVYTSEERQMLQKEVGQLSSDISQTYQSARFSDQNVFGSKTTTSTPLPQLTEAQATSGGYDADHIIHNASEFVSKVTGNESENFILMGDIDLSSLGTLSGAVFQNAYSGTFDGNGYNIMNLTINNTSADNVGIFSVLNNATINNLGMKNIQISANSYNNVGVLAGQVNNSTITKSHVASSSVSGKDNVGLLAGYTNETDIFYSQTQGSVVSYGNNAGGLIGHVERGGFNYSFDHVFSTANVQGVNNVGGLAGQLTNTGGFAAYATGNVTASGNNAGGFAGNANNGGLWAVYSTSNVQAASSAGGLIGVMTGGSLGASYAAEGNITAGSNVGGLVGTKTGGTIGNFGCPDFYKNNLSVAIGSGAGTAINANIQPMSDATFDWNAVSYDHNTYDFSGSLPALVGIGAFGTTVSTSAPVDIHVGDDASKNSQINLDNTFTLGNVDFYVTSQAGARFTISQVDDLMKTLNSKRSEVGASVNKLSSVISIQDNRINNLGASRSNINDTDIASESAQMVKNQIRQQSGVALLSQMNGLDKNLIMQLIG